MRVGQMCVEQVFLYMMLKFTHNDVWSPLPRNCSAGYAGSVGRRRIEKSIHHRDSAPPQIFQTSWTISGAKHGVQGVRSCAFYNGCQFSGFKEIHTDEGSQFTSCFHRTYLPYWVTTIKLQSHITRKLMVWSRGTIKRKITLDLWCER